MGDVSPLSRKKLVDTGCVVSRLCRPTALDGALGVPEEGEREFTPSRTTKNKCVAHERDPKTIPCPADPFLETGLGSEKLGGVV